MTSSLSLGGKILLALAALFGALYFAIGVTWLVAPAAAAGALKASLLEGTGLATQIGDSAALFLSAGVFMLYGVLKRQGIFLLAGGLLIGLVAPARLIAWQVHGAALTLDSIVIEVLTFVVLGLAARTISER